MKKIIEFFKNWFEKNGLIKVLAAFVLLIISTLIVRNTSESSLLSKSFSLIGVISACYLVLTVLVFTIVGIVNSIKDKLK